MIVLFYLLLAVAYLLIGRAIVLKVHNRYFVPASETTAGLIILLWPSIILVGLSMGATYLIFILIEKLFTMVGKFMVGK